jgi:hypothetical protein
MAATFNRLAIVIALVGAASTAAAAQSLKPEWSRPVGGKTRLVGVEEYGRCSVFVDNGAIQVVAPSGVVSWTWPFSKISKYINPRDVAVSHECDAIAFVGDASYKYVWIVDRDGQSASIKFVATPADAEFDRTGKRVAIGTYAGSIFLYSVTGELIWKRDTHGGIANDLEFTDDNERILIKGWSGAGVVSMAGQVEWSQLANGLAASRDLSTFVFPYEPNHGPGPSGVTVTDARRETLWGDDGWTRAYLSATGDRVLVMTSGNQLRSRNGDVIYTYDGYRFPITISGDGTRVWLLADDRLDCLDDRGQVLATIAVVTNFWNVKVGRDFGQVLVVTEKDLRPVSVERYVIPAPCRQ